MKFITAELKAKIDNGSATDTEQSVYQLLSVFEGVDLTPDEAVQVITQADAICDARAQGRPDVADALLALFSSGEAVARKTTDGFEFQLTDAGIAHAADLVKRLAASQRGKLN